MLDDDRFAGFMLEALPDTGILDLKTKGGAATALTAVISAVASTNDYRAAVMSGMALSESSTNPTPDDIGIPSAMVSDCFQPGFRLLSILLGDERGDSEKCMQEWSDVADASKQRREYKDAPPVPPGGAPSGSADEPTGASTTAQKVKAARHIIQSASLPPHATTTETPPVHAVEVGMRTSGSDQLLDWQSNIMLFAALSLSGAGWGGYGFDLNRPFDHFLGFATWLEVSRNTLNPGPPRRITRTPIRDHNRHNNLLWDPPRLPLDPLFRPQHVQLWATCSR